MLIQWVVLLGLLLTVGCGSVIKEVPGDKIIMVNADGQPVDPTGNVPSNSDSNSQCQTKLNTNDESVGSMGNVSSNPGSKDDCDKKHSIFLSYPPYDKDAYGKHIKQVIKGLHEYTEKNGGKPNKILIHVHGGLNYQVATVERAAEIYSDILREGSYPIFINWQSSFFPSYWNHLTHIRQGEDWHQGTLSRIGAYLTAPFYFAADLARATIRLPTATFLQIRNDIETVPWLSWFHSADLILAQQTAFEDLCGRKKRGDTSVANALEEYTRILDRRIADCEKVDEKVALSSKQDLGDLKISLGLDERTGWEKFEASIKYILTSPTKLVSAPIIDALGTSSWNVMLRSISQLFHRDGREVAHTSLDRSGKDKYDFSQTGSLSVFLEQLQDTICGDNKLSPSSTGSLRKECANKGRWEITLVGHSMGAIIVNHIIREFGDLPIKNVIYLAAASTIQDYQDTIFPYLTNKNASIPSSNPKAEASTSVKPELCSDDRRNGVCVYHLMLHEAAESGEWISDILDPFPRGSLLVWLDNFLSHPLSREDRMLGRFTNLILAAHHTPQALRPHINIVKFGVGEGVLSPQKHGEFGGNLKFWKPECWRIPASDLRNCYRANGHY